MTAPARELRRALAGAAAAALTALAVASCTNVLALDDYQGAADAICGMLKGCYASGGPSDCTDHVNTIGEASQEAADQWLHTIGKGCLDNCSAARFCLDVSPVCAPNPGDACTAKEDCCTFSKGAHDCVAERCCITDGHRCVVGQDSDCCTGVCNPETGTCGGTQCRDAGLPCDIGAQCCTGLCRGKTCSETICDEDGFGCKTGDNCCSGYCDGGKCGQPKKCGLLRSACTSDADCCGPDGATSGGFCYLPPDAPTGLCSTANNCAPLESDCSTDAQCCSSYCDRTYHKCGEACLAAGTACGVDAECCSGQCQDGACSAACSSAYCTVDADCCTQHCISGTCAPACGTAACDHSVCALGGPLRQDCDKLGLCVIAVCDVDPYCCCNAWDSFCALEAESQTSCIGLCN